MQTFDQAWLYESVRHQELERPLPDEQHVNRVALDATEEFQGQLLARAQASVVTVSALAAQAQVRHCMRLAVALLWLLSLLAGVSLGLASLGDSSRAVNVIWSLGSLLLVPSLMLLLWFALMFGSPGGSGLLGRWWPALVGYLLQKTDKAKVWQAWLAMATRSGAQRWWLAFMTHTMWLWLMLGVLLSMTLAFSLRHYTFVWETTWLSEAMFERLAQVVGYLPGLLGFALPDGDTIRNSGNVALLDADARRAWASWLVGAVFVFGLLPRLILSMTSLIVARHCERGYRISLDDAYALTIRAKLAALKRQSQPDGPAGEPDRWRRLTGLAGDQALSAAAWLALETEVSQSERQSLSKVAIEVARADDRDSRQQAVAQLQALRPKRLLVAVDARQTPDRGAMRAIIDCATHAVATSVLLLQTDAERARTAHWHQRFDEIDLVTIFEDTQSAIQWLEGDSR
jgi:hypothetical protein